MRFLTSIADGLGTLRDFPPLFFRLCLAFVFYAPFLFHFDNVSGFGEFLAKLDVPAPHVFAWVVTICEGLGIPFLIFGFATRLISLCLGGVMVVAIATVHWQHGWSSTDNGFEKPLYYLLMLLSLIIGGPGRISVDAIFARSARQPRS